MRIDHFQMPFCHRQINRLAHCATRMMQPWQHIGQLYQILKIGHRGIAAFIIEVTNEWRPIDRGKHHFVATYFDRTRRVAGMLDIA